MEAHAPLRLRARQRVKRNADFQAARTQGRRLDCGAFLLVWRRREAPPADGGAAPGPARVGVVAARVAVGNSVARHRAKRRLREMFRRNQALVPPGLDLILTARASLLEIDTADLERRFVHACGRLSSPKNG